MVVLVMVVILVMVVMVISTTLALTDNNINSLFCAACLKIDCKQTKTATYEAIKSLIQSSDDFFEFIYYHEKMFKNKPRGMGAG